MAANKAGGYKANDLRKCLHDIVFAYTYPRLDAEVTKKMNHLLKVCVCVWGGGAQTQQHCCMVSMILSRSILYCG
jgi:hypothetical protein